MLHILRAPFGKSDPGGRGVVGYSRGRGLGEFFFFSLPPPPPPMLETMVVNVAQSSTELALAVMKVL